MCVECGCTPAPDGQAARARNQIIIEPGAKPKPGDINVIDENGTKIAIANADGTLYAFDATCTHQGCSLGDGELDGTSVICPCHLGTYDIKTGEVLAGPPPAPIRTYAVRLAEESLA